MAKGAKAKEEIINKIMEVYPSAFKYDKEIRIPMVEDGEQVEIKVTLTCAKVNVGGGGATSAVNVTNNASTIVEITEEEKKAVSDLVESLGL